MNFLIQKYKLKKFRKQYRLRYPESLAYPVNIFPFDKFSIGTATYGPIEADFFGSNDEKLTIGSFCSIASGVKFIVGGEHALNHASTYPIKKLGFDICEAFSKGPIVVHDDVWIGGGSLVLSGVSIGQGAVIAAGSVIHKNVPPYAITDGKRVIRLRFSEEIIDVLLQLDYSKLTFEQAKADSEILSSPIENIQDAQHILDMAKKQGWARNY